MPRGVVFIFSKSSHGGAKDGPCNGALGTGSCAFVPHRQLSQHLFQPSSQLELPGPHLVPVPGSEVSTWCAQFTNFNCSHRVGRCQGLGPRISSPAPSPPAGQGACWVGKCADSMAPLPPPSRCQKNVPGPQNYKPRPSSTACALSCVCSGGQAV